MMKSKLFRDRQEARASDFNDTQEFTRASLDALVADAITEDARYKGLSVAQASGTEVTVGQGRLYDQGRVYGRDVQATRDLIADLPVAAKRYVTVVAYGQTVETGVAPRDFLIDLDAGTTEPQAVAMDEVRRVEIGFTSGSEGVSPTTPTVPAGQVRIADILLSPTGIVSVTMTAKNQLAGLQGAKDEIRHLNTFRDGIRPRVESLQSTLSDVRDVLDEKAGADQMVELQSNLSDLRRSLGLPSGTTDWSFDDFRDNARTDDAVAGAADAAYLLDNGLGFPNGGEVTAALDLFNPLESAVVKSGSGWVSPAYTSVLALEVGAPSGEVALSSYTSTSTETRKVTRHKTVTKTGTRKGDLIAAEVYFGDFRRMRVNEGSGSLRWSKGRQRQRWYDYGKRSGDIEKFGNLRMNWVHETERYSYQDRVPYTASKQVETSQTHTGMTLAQTFTAPRLMVLTKVALHFTDLGGSGDVTVLLTGQTMSGKPNTDDVRVSTTIAHADLVANGETEVPIEPTLLEASERLALVLVTNGSHRHQTSENVAAFQGSVFYGGANDWQETEPEKALNISLFAAKYRRPRAEVRLADISLAGGITNLEIATERDEPRGTAVSFEYQWDGIWYPLASADRLVANQPSTLPLRAVFVGSPDVQPTLKTGADRVTATVVGNTLVHYSTVRNLSSATSSVTVTLDVAAFDPANESVDVVLLDADNAFAEVAPASVEVVGTQTIVRPDDTETGMYNQKRQYTFTPTSLLNYAVKITGSTGASALRPFSVAERVDAAA